MTFKKLLLTSAVMAMSTQFAVADVKFGSLFPFSGSLALLGEESARGLEIAVDEINAKGGVQSEKVLLVRGDAVDNNQAIGEARRLISVENVAGVFGTFSSGRAVAASQVTEKWLGLFGQVFTLCKWTSAVYYAASGSAILLK